MENTEPFVWFAPTLLIIIGGLILIPYLLRKDDLLTAWNILLVGIAIFVGLGCIETVTSSARQPVLQWFSPTQEEVSWYITVVTSFMVALLVSYYLNPIARPLAAKTFTKWPPLTSNLHLVVIAFCFAIQVLSIVTMEHPFFGRVFFKLSHKAWTFAVVFAFMLWYRNRLNAVWFITFAAVFSVACVLSMKVGMGRRLLLAMFVGPVLCVYWVHARNWRPTRGLAVIAVGILGVFVVSLMYSSIRHFSQWKGHMKRERTTEAIIEQIQTVGQRRWMEAFMSDKLFYLSQQTVHYSLMVKRYVDMGQLDPIPLNTIRFIVRYPIPRRLWPDKPIQIGVTSTIVIAGTGTTNWGTGIGGHAAYEGGIPAIMLYGALLGFGIRFFDEPLKRQPTNPFLIAMLTSASPHILAWARGDIANMSLEMAECVLFAVMAIIVCRILFGTERKKATSPAYVAPAARGYPYPGKPLGPPAPNQGR
jgi:hypothetical protein